MEPCSCETIAHGDLGLISDEERLLRVLTDRHFNAKGKLKPNAFPLTDIKERGLSLVRLDHISSEKLAAVVQNIVDLSKAVEPRGALVSAGWIIRDEKFADGGRSLCLKDDPVEPDGAVIENLAHAITMATKKLDDVGLQALRDRLLTIFSDATPMHLVA